MSSSRSLLRTPSHAIALALAALMPGCQDAMGPPTDGLRFGQLGEARVEIVTPRLSGAGELRQVIEWSASGAWLFTESLSYGGEHGDTQVRESTGDPGLLAGEYAAWITLVNETPGIQLVGYAPLNEALDPDCGRFRSRVTVSIVDEPRNDTLDWSRCAEDALSDLDPRGAGTDPPAGRVVQAAVFLRDRTVGADVTSAYAGSLPFATLLRGRDLTAAVPGGGVIRDAETWTSFWADVRGQGPPPDVDFSSDVVLVGEVGVREEAGDSIEIRRVLPVQFGTRVELVERIAGNFCAPAELRHTPFHVVVAPEVPAPVQFNRVRVELVPCPR